MRFSAKPTPSNPKVTAKTLIVLAVITLILVGGPLLWFRYENNQFAKVLNSLDIPSNWHLINDDTNGNRVCLDACYSQARTYEISSPGTGQDLKAELDGIIKKTDFSVLYSDVDCNDETASVGSICNILGVKKGIELSINIAANDKKKLAVIRIGNADYLWGFVDDD